MYNKLSLIASFLILFIILTLFPTFSTALNSQPNFPPSWNKYIVIGDAFRIEFFHNLLKNLKSEYALEGLHNTVQTWIDYRSWMRYPSEWSNIRNLISISHNYGLPVGVVFGSHVSGPVDAPENSPEGFLYYYKHIIPQDEKWRYPNGTVANDPYTVGASRSFSGALVIRVLGEEIGRRDFYAIMQPQNPYWEQFLVRWGRKAVDAGADSIFIDGIDGPFVFYWGGGWGCSNTWEGRGLIRYLKKTFSSEELKKMGVYNIENFCLKDYLAKKYGVKEVHGSYVSLRGRFNASLPIENVEFRDLQGVLNDQIFRAAVIYWYKSAISFIRNVSEGIRAYASSKGRAVAITSNEYLAWIPHITVTPYMDIIYVEMNQFRPPPYQTNYVISKMAQASGNYSKKVWVGEWVLWFSNPFKPEQPPSNSSTLVKALVAQIYSSGAVMLVPFGTGTPPEGWPPKRLVSGMERESVAKYYRFISGNRMLFENTSSLADVALLVSLPTAIWNFFPSFDYYRSNDYRKEIYGWARALERIHIDYDVLLSGMRGVLTTNASDTLDKYKLIIAPQATHISDRDFAALLDYVKGGGRLIVTENFGLYDDLGNYRDSDARTKLLSNANVTVLNGWIGLSFENSLENRVIDNPSLNKIRNVVDNLYSKNILINTTGNVIFTLRSNKYTGDIFIYLVNHNYYYNASEDWVKPKSSIPIKVKLPDGYRVKSVEIYSPDFARDKMSVNYTVESGYLEFKVPALRLWDIVRIVYDRTGEAKLPSIRVSPRVPSSLVVGESELMTVVVENEGRGEAYDVTIELTDLNGCDVEPKFTSLGTLAPGERSEVSFRIKPLSEECSITLKVEWKSELGRAYSSTMSISISAVHPMVEIAGVKVPKDLIEGESGELIIIVRNPIEVGVKAKLMLEAEAGMEIFPSERIFVLDPGEEKSLTFRVSGKAGTRSLRVALYMGNELMDEEFLKIKIAAKATWIAPILALVVVFVLLTWMRKRYQRQTQKQNKH